MIPSTVRPDRPLRPTASIRDCTKWRRAKWTLCPNGFFDPPVSGSAKAAEEMRSAPMGDVAMLISVCAAFSRTLALLSPAFSISTGSSGRIEPAIDEREDPLAVSCSATISDSASHAAKKTFARESSTPKPLAPR